MRSKALTISILSTFLLAGGSCSLGDFCAVYTPVPPVSEEVAQKLVSQNRASATAIGTNETYYARECAG